MADGSRRTQELQLPTDRVDGDVHLAVVVEVGRREAAADDPWQVVPADERGPVREPGWRARGCAHVLEHLNRLRVPREIGHRDSAVGEHQVGIAVQVEVDPGRAPAGERLAKRWFERCSNVGERRPGGEGLLSAVDRMRLSAGIRDEQVGVSVTVEVRSRDTHPRIRVGHAGDGCALLEAEAETRGIGLLPARPRDVLVQPVRVAVVGDVQIGPAVTVEVGEDRPEAVIEPRGLEARLNAHLPKAGVPVLVPTQIQVEKVADAGEVVGKAGSRAGDREVGVGIARHEEVGTAVAVHIGDRRTRMPAKALDPGSQCALGERAVAVVPEQLVPSIGRDEEVGVAVPVEVRGDAALASDRRALLPSCGSRSGSGPLCCGRGHFAAGRRACATDRRRPASTSSRRTDRPSRRCCSRERRAHLPSSPAGRARPRSETPLDGRRARPEWRRFPGESPRSRRSRHDRRRLPQRAGPRG